MLQRYRLSYQRLSESFFSLFTSLIMIQVVKRALFLLKKVISEKVPLTKRDSFLITFFDLKQTCKIVFTESC